MLAGSMHGARVRRPNSSPRVQTIADIPTWTEEIRDACWTPRFQQKRNYLISLLTTTAAPATVTKPPHHLPNLSQQQPRSSAVTTAAAVIAAAIRGGHRTHNLHYHQRRLKRVKRDLEIMPGWELWQVPSPTAQGDNTEPAPLHHHHRTTAVWLAWPPGPPNGPWHAMRESSSALCYVLL